MLDATMQPQFIVPFRDSNVSWRLTNASFLGSKPHVVRLVEWLLIMALIRGTEVCTRRAPSVLDLLMVHQTTSLSKTSNLRFHSLQRLYFTPIFFKSKMSQSEAGRVTACQRAY